MTYEKFSAANAAMLLIDHQVGTMSWVKSIPFEEMKRNALMLAQTARILKLPVVLTASSVVLGIPAIALFAWMLIAAIRRGSWGMSRAAS